MIINIHGLQLKKGLIRVSFPAEVLNQVLLVLKYPTGEKKIQLDCWALCTQLLCRYSIPMVHESSVRRKTQTKQATPRKEVHYKQRT
jgi:hypothetical protein